MDVSADKPCANCAVLERRIAALEAKLALLQKNSTNSSKPPSSDIVKPRRPSSGAAGKRKRGGQPGHPRHEWPSFAPEDIDERMDYTLSVCPDCGGRTTPLDLAPRIVQQVEVVAAPTTVSEHRGQACYCGRRQKTHYADIPAAVRRQSHLGLERGPKHPSLPAHRGPLLISPLSGVVPTPYLGAQFSGSTSLPYG